MCMIYYDFDTRHYFFSHDETKKHLNCFFFSCTATVALSVKNFFHLH